MRQIPTKLHKKCTFQTQLKVRGYLLQVLVDGDVSHEGLLTQQLSGPEEKNQFNFTSVFLLLVYSCYETNKRDDLKAPAQKKHYCCTVWLLEG